MINPIQFFVEGSVRGQPRPRAFARGGRAAVYDPGTAEGWKGLIALEAKSLIPTDPLTGPLRVDLTFAFKRPKSHYHTGKKNHILRNDAPDYHTSRPDLDNCCKAVFDALTTIRMWNDDAQVCDGRVRKIYSVSPGLTVKISEAMP